jgi:hypothetical protein
MGALSQLLRDSRELYDHIKAISRAESVDQDDIDHLQSLLSDMQDNVTDLESSIEDEEEDEE